MNMGAASPLQYVQKLSQRRGVLCKWPRYIPHPHFRKLSGDRKSTRLNSSHLVISYAVFCLKKKTHILPAFLQPPALLHPLHTDIPSHPPHTLPTPFNRYTLPRTLRRNMQQCAVLPSHPPRRP